MIRESLILLGALLTLASLCSSTKANSAEKPPISWEIEADVSGIAKSRFKGLPKTGDVAILDSSFSAVASFEAKSGFLIRFGFDLQRHDFDVSGSGPFPGVLQSYAFTVGADLQLGDAWLARIDLHPGFYNGGDSLRSADFNLPVTMGVSYFVSADLQFILGLSVDVNRKYPVLPAVGLRWRLARSWVLDAILPTPRLEYSLTQSLTLYVGADLRGDTYRMDGNFGRSDQSSRLANGIADYSQIRAGAGASWSINANTALQLEAGVVPVHELNFYRSDVRLRSSEIPPYLGISLKAGF